MFIYVNRIWLSEREKTFLTTAFLQFYLSGTQSQEAFKKKRKEKKRFGASVSSLGMIFFVLYHNLHPQ